MRSAQRSYDTCATARRAGAAGGVVQEPEQIVHVGAGAGLSFGTGSEITAQGPAALGGRIDVAEDVRERRAHVGVHPALEVHALRHHRDAVVPPACASAAASARPRRMPPPSGGDPPATAV